MKTKIIIVSILMLMLGVSCDSESIVENDTVQNQSSSKTTTAVLAASTFTESQVTPKFGKPSNTSYYFKVLDASGALGLSVKLYERATGTTTYLAMVRIGNYWTLSTQLAQNGWYDYRYVYTATQQPISTIASYELCNTRTVYVASGTSSLRWPFGADGSTWSNRLGWNGGGEGGCGNGPGQGGHLDQGCYAKDQLADDWNKNTASCGSPNLDLGAIVKAPIDGKVVYAQADTSTYGNRVDIEQTMSDGSVIRFRVAHLNSISVAVNTWVKAGFTNIGTVGKNGLPSTSAPHAHCVLYKNGGGCYSPLAFKFNAL